ncbi:hypothetical protein HK405_003331, partial [Cladochytrium tenue]
LATGDVAVTSTAAAAAAVKVAGGARRQRRHGRAPPATVVHFLGVHAAAAASAMGKPGQEQDVRVRLAGRLLVGTESSRTTFIHWRRCMDHGRCETAPNDIETTASSDEAFMTAGPRRSERLRRMQPSPKAPGATGRAAMAVESAGATTAKREPRGSRTAVKRRKVHAGSAIAGSTKMVTDLPLTLIATIVELVDPTAALALSRSCRILRNMLDPREIVGKGTWRKVRETDGWPDPAAIAMSDYTFLTSMFGRGCNFCSEHPQVKTVYFKFRGFRLCPACFKKQTVWRHDLPEEVSGIPSLWLSSTRSGRREIEYFFLPDVHLMSAPEEIDESVRQRLALRCSKLDEFVKAVEKNEERLKSLALRAKAAKLSDKQTLVDKFMKSKFPFLDALQYRDLAAYKKECERLNQFGPRPQAALEEAVALVVDERRAWFAQIRLNLYLYDRCRLLNINKVPSVPVIYDFLPEDEMALIVDKAIASEANLRLREQWLKQHASSVVDTANFAAVQKLPAYVSAQPDDEPAFLEQLAQSRASIPADLRAALESEEALRGQPDFFRGTVLRDTVNAAVELSSLTGEAAVAVSDRAKTLLQAVGQEAFDRSLTEGILFCLRCWKYVDGDGGATRSIMLLHPHTDCTDYGVFYWLLSSPPPPESVLSRYPEILRQVQGPARPHVAVPQVLRKMEPGYRQAAALPAAAASTSF